MGPDLKSLVVLVTTSVSAWGEFSKLPLRCKANLLLSTQSINPSEKGSFVVITREELQSKGGKDAASMASALRTILKSHGQKERRKSLVASQNTEDDETQTQIQLPPELEEELAHDETSLGHVSSEASLNIGRKILSISDQEAAPDKIFILDGFPANAEEAETLLSAKSDGILDAVVELTGGEDEETPAPSRAASRLSNVSLSVSETNSSNFSTSSPHEMTVEKKMKESKSVTLLSESNSQELSRVVSELSLPDPSSLASKSSSRYDMLEYCADPFALGSTVPENHVMASLREAKANANGPRWSDVAFLQLPVVPRSDEEDPEDYRPLPLLGKFVKLLNSIAIEKYRFKRYISLCKITNIPKPPSILKKFDLEEVLLDRYKARCDHFKIEETISVAVILEQMISSIDECLTLKDWGNTKKENNSESEETEEKEHEKDEIEFPSLKNETSEFTPGSLILINKGDDLLLKYARAYRKYSSRVSRSNLEVEREKIRSVLFPGGRGRQQMPRKPLLPKQERGAEATRFGNFSTISDKYQTHISRIMSSFERLMYRIDPKAAPLYNFKNRNCLLELNSDVLPQVMSLALSWEPEVHTSYNKQLDQLLVAVHRRTPIGRRCTVNRSAFLHTNLRPGFSEWPSIDLRKRLTVFDMDVNLLRSVEQHSEYLFPCDHSIVQVQRNLSGSASWCTILKDDIYFGLRKNGKDSVFYSAFPDDSFMEIGTGPKWPGKPDGFGTVNITNTCASGLTVRHCSNGTIWQSQMRKTDEESRLLFSHGTVIRALKDGRKMILYSNGDVAISRSGASAKKKSWEVRSFKNNGRLYTKNEKGEVKDMENEDGKPIISSCQLDPEKRCTVWKRFDGVTLIDYEDGSKLVKHVDGTIILERHSTVQVQCQGFATVIFNTEAEATAYKHSQGGRVDISRGGCSIRSTTFLPDKTKVEIEYDTRVTAKINGSVRTTKSDGTVIVAFDDSSVEFRPWNVNDIAKAKRNKGDIDSSVENIPKDAREKPDDSLGCFLFKLPGAELKMTDWENNVFMVKNATSGKQQIIDVDLAGEFDPIKAVINEPIEPRLFVLSGDGTGIELLSQDKVEEERRRIEVMEEKPFQYNHETTLLSPIMEPVSLSLTQEMSNPKPPHPSLKKKRSVDNRSSSIIKSNSNRMRKLRTSGSQGSMRKDQNPEGNRKQCGSGISYTLELAKKDDGLEQVTKSLMPEIYMNETFSIPKTEMLRPVSWTYVENLKFMKPLSDEEIGNLKSSDSTYMVWKREQSAKEDQFEVKDGRDEASIEIEMRLQKRIVKEQSKIRKALRKQSRRASKLGSISLEQKTIDSSTISGEMVLDSYTLNNPTYIIEEDPTREVSQAIEEEKDTLPTQDDIYTGRPETPPSRNKPLTTVVKNYWDELNGI